MNKVLILSTLMTIIAFVSCNNTDDNLNNIIPEREYAKTASASLVEIGKFTGGHTQLSIMKNETELEFEEEFYISFSNYGKELGYVDLSLCNDSSTTKIFKMDIQDVFIEGKPYNIEIEHYTEKAKLTIDSKNEQIAASIKGWAKCESFAMRAEETRTSPTDPIFESDITIEFTDSEGNDWEITIYEM